MADKEFKFEVGQKVRFRGDKRVLVIIERKKRSRGYRKALNGY